MSVKIKPMNFLTYLYGCALGLEQPQKLNRENFPSDQSVKIGPLKNFLLYVRKTREGAFVTFYKERVFPFFGHFSHSCYRYIHVHTLYM